MTPNDVKIVAENIDDFIEVPNGVTRLRNAVLILAVSGKLVPQEKKEGTAEKFYTQIQSERADKSGGRKVKAQNLKKINSDTIPFEIPESWKWVELEEVC